MFQNLLVKLKKIKNFIQIIKIKNISEFHSILCSIELFDCYPEFKKLNKRTLIIFTRRFEDDALFDILIIKFPRGLRNERAEDK